MRGVGVILRRLLLLSSLPILAALFLFGWICYVVGERRRTRA